MKMTCPCKTFLVGEYAILYNGPAILLATPPYFKLEGNRFTDPLQGIGGFGASGARFVLKNISENPTLNALDVYKKYHAHKLSGSGADIICQFTGGVTFFNPQENDDKKIEMLEWPFPDLWIFLFHTGFKTPTHQHLKTLADSHNQLQFEPLKKIVFETYAALQQTHEKNFIECINNYERALDSLGLVCSSTKKLLNKIKSQPEILAAKGCGALGSDVILAITSIKHKQHFTDWALNEKLNIIFQGNHFAKGVEIIP